MRRQITPHCAPIGNSERPGKRNFSRLGDSLHNGEELHVHHVIPKSQGGEDTVSNLTLVHLYCHQQIHQSRKVKV